MMKFHYPQGSPKSYGGTSCGKPFGSDEKKPLANGGSIIKDKQQKYTAVLVKRPLDKASSSALSSAKKPKFSGTTTEVKVKRTHFPIAQRMKKANTLVIKSSTTKTTKVTKSVSSSSKKINKNLKKVMKNSKYSKSTKMLPSSGDGQKKWTTLVHSVVIFPHPYTPHGVKMLYKGKEVSLTPAQEEVATMFAVMLDTDYMQKDKFKENFWNDWRKLLGKNHVVQNLDNCDFKPIYNWHQEPKAKKKQMTSEEKAALKEDKLKQEEKYMWAIVDGVREGNHLVYFLFVSFFPEVSVTVSRFDKQSCFY